MLLIIYSPAREDNSRYKRYVKYKYKLYKFDKNNQSQDRLNFPFRLTQMRGVRGSGKCVGRTQSIVEYSRLSTRMDWSLDRIQFSHGTNIIIFSKNFHRPGEESETKMEKKKNVGFCSIRVLVPREEGNPCPVPDPVWKTSVQRRSSSAMVIKDSVIIT